MKYLQLIRIKHWVKNTFMFLPVFFAGKPLELQTAMQLIIGFFAFCFVASSIYILNDIKDIQVDKLHPRKKFRPLASGDVKIDVAIIIAIIFFISGFIIAIETNIKFAFILGIYFTMNLAYSYALKHISILDIIIISIGFVLRIKSGSVITTIPLSHWIVIMVFLLALFMAIAKRRDDIILKMESGKDLRESSKKYNLDFLNNILSLISGVIIVSYIMYTVDPEVILRLGSHRLHYTSLFVIAGLIRYLQITLVENNSGSPTRLLLKDRFIQVCLLAWILSFYFLIYIKNIVLFE